MATNATTTVKKSSSPKGRSKSVGRNRQKTETAIKPLQETVLVAVADNNDTSCLAMENYESNTQQEVDAVTEFVDKTQALRYMLETDLLGCDAKWTLFVAAALSYRYDSKLIPFPPQYAHEQTGYDIVALVSVINDTPKLRVILQNIVDQNYHEFGSEVIELLYWVLITMREPAFRLVEGEELDNILKSIDDKSVTTKPTHVFELQTTSGLNSESAFHDRVSNLPIKLAFLGNKLDNYFSIIHKGLTQQNENDKYIELTTDLHTSQKLSPNGAAWGASQCGSIISCTAICEFAYDTATDQIATNKHNKSCVNVKIENPQRIRVRYLLFYGSRFQHKLLPQRRFLSWICRHKFSLSFISYMLLMVSIGVANSGTGYSFKIYIKENIEKVLNFCKRIIAIE